MGIIILPVLLLAFIMLIVAIVLTVKLLIDKKVGIKEFLLGLIASLSLFGLILVCYKILGSAWALGPAFVVPTFLIFMPFGFYFLVWITKLEKLDYFSKVILLSVIFSGILAIVFYDFYFDFFDIIGVKKVY